MSVRCHEVQLTHGLVWEAGRKEELLCGSAGCHRTWPVCTHVSLPIIVLMDTGTLLASAVTAATSWEKQVNSHQYLQCQAGTNGKKTVQRGVLHLCVLRNKNVVNMSGICS